MSICRECGEPIVFRKIDGTLRPIHVNGNWCSTLSQNRMDRPFRSVESYTNPNAYCPVCGEKVFFHQSRNGGRVFFDNLGWPWSKHPCTDNGRQISKRPPVTRGFISVVNREGETLRIYDLDDLQKVGSRFIFTLRNSERGTRINLTYSDGSLKNRGLVIDDFWDAPSFLVRKLEKPNSTYKVEFISARLAAVIGIRMSLNR